MCQYCTNNCAAFGKPQAIKTDDSESTEHNDRTEEGTQLRQRRNNSIHDTEIGDTISYY